MLTIPAINGVYSMESLSGGTYHELTLVPKGTISADISVQIRRMAADSFEQYSNYTINTLVTFLLAGSIEEVRIITTNSSGTGTIQAEVTSREQGVLDTFPRGRAYIQSIARVFLAGVALITSGRPNLNFIEVQNRDAQAIYFW